MMSSPIMPTLDLNGRTILYDSCSNSLGMMLMGDLLDLPFLSIRPFKYKKMCEISAAMRISRHSRSLSTGMSAVKRYLKKRWFCPMRNEIPQETRTTLPRI